MQQVRAVSVESCISAVGIVAKKKYYLVSNNSRKHRRIPCRLLESRDLLLYLTFCFAHTRQLNDTLGHIRAGGQIAVGAVKHAKRVGGDQHLPTHRTR